GTIMTWTLTMDRTRRDSMIPMRGSIHGLTQLQPASVLECSIGKGAAMAHLGAGRLAVLSSLGNDNFEITTGEFSYRLQAPRTRLHALAVSPDGGLLIGAGGDGLIRIWEIPNGSILQKLRGSDVACTAVAVTANGRVVIGGFVDGLLRAWDLNTAREIWACR